MNLDQKGITTFFKLTCWNQLLGLRLRLQILHPLTPVLIMSVHS